MLQFSHGAVQWLTTQALNTIIPVTGSTFATNSSTGQTFEPKAIRFYWMGIQSNSPTNLVTDNTVNGRRGVGFASSATSRATVGTFTGANAGNAATGTVYSTTAIAITVTAAGAVDGLLDVSSITTDGFNLIVDLAAPANITIFWEAWGGNEITNVTVGTITEPAATGNQTYTATGFVASPATDDQCVMFAGCQATAVSGTGAIQDSGFNVGFATSTSTANNITVCGNSDEGFGSMDTDGYNYTGECLSMITVAGGNPNARATLTAYGTDTFTLNWLERGALRRNIYMAIKGGEWYAGSTTINGNTLNSTATIGGLPFNIRGISLIGTMKTQSTQDTSTIDDRIGFGTATSTTARSSVSMNDPDGPSISDVGLALYYSQVLAYPSTTGTLLTAYDINALGANSVQLITDTAGGVASEWIGYLVFGDRKPRTISIGHPFIN